MKRIFTSQACSIISIIFLLATISSCVTARKYEEAKLNSDRAEASLKQCEETVKNQLETIDGLNKDLSDINRSMDNLKRDTSDYGIKYRNILKMNDNLNALYEKVIVQNKALLENTNIENQKLMAELNEKERQLNLQRQELQKQEQSLKTKETELDGKEDNIKALIEDIKIREKKVKELQNAINAKDSIVAALKNKVSNALLGFQDNELTIEQKGARVYVSLAEKLLFKSGSSDVDAKGKDALKKLAEVLIKNPDIDIVIEGHTDNVPIINSPRMKDNWDLSVLRATSILRILQDAGVSSKRLLPSGRGEYFPVASNETAEGKSKNRRTEIILSPKLDELLKILESN